MLGDIDAESSDVFEQARFQRVSKEIDLFSYRASQPKDVLNFILELLLGELKCHRAWLLYACDPEIESWSVPFEKTSPEFPGAHDLEVSLPMSPEIFDLVSISLAADGVLCYDGSSSLVVPESARTAFQVEAMMVLALHPRLGRAWMIGLHHCAGPRLWSEQDKRFFFEISLRLCETLSSFLYLQRLDSTEMKLSNIFEKPADAHLECSAEGLIFRVSPSVREFLGREPYEFAGTELSSYFLHEMEYLVLWKRTKIHSYVPFQEVNLIGAQGERVHCLISARSHGTGTWLSLRKLSGQAPGEEERSVVRVLPQQARDFQPCSLLIGSHDLEIENLLNSWASQERIALRTVRQSQQIQRELQGTEFDILLLEKDLCGASLRSFCADLHRDFPHLSIVVLGMNDSPRERAAVYDAGADDLLTSPLDVGELISRVRAVWRRRLLSSPARDTSASLSRGRLHLDPGAYQATVDGSDVNLTTTEFAILLVLARMPGRVVSREQLLNAVWGDDFYGSPRTVDSHLRNIRMKLKSQVEEYAPIRAVRGVGYKFED